MKTLITTILALMLSIGVWANGATPTVISAWNYPHPTPNPAPGFAANEGAVTEGTNLIFRYASGVTPNIGHTAADRDAINAPNNSGGWAPASGDITVENTGGWIITLDTRGFEDITFSARQSTSNNGPAQFRLAYRLGTAGTWTVFGERGQIPQGPNNGPGVSVGTGANMVQTFEDVAIPSTVNNQSVVQIMVWVETRSRRSDGALTLDVAGGNTSINNIVFRGIGEPPPITELTISDVGFTPAAPTQNDAVTVTATVTEAASPVATVTLEWELDGAPQADITMTAGANDTWTATIPAQAIGADVFFRVSAENSVTPTAEVAESDWYYFIVLDADNIGGYHGDLTWTVSNNVLTISVTADAPVMAGMEHFYIPDGTGDAALSPAPWADVRTLFNAVVIAERVTSIGENAFRGIREIATLTLGEDLETIGENAFRGLTQLTEVTIPNSVTYIGPEAFRGLGVVATHADASRLASVTLGTGLTSTGVGAFRQLPLLTSIEIPDNITAIDDETFRQSGLTSIVIPEGVITIGEGAFRQMPFLTSAVISNSVTSIGVQAFDEAPLLASIIIGESVETIGDRGISRNPLLAMVMILNDVPPTFYRLNDDGTPHASAPRMFENLVAGTCLIVPYGAIDAYEAAPHWYAAFTCIEEPPTELIIASIGHYPAVPTYEDDIVVTATILSLGGAGISAIVLEWRLEGDDETTLDTMELEGSVWTATISAQAAGASVEYRIIATNDLDEVTTSEWYNVLVYIATELVITNVSHYPTAPTATQDVTVTATVTYTRSDVASVVIEWNRVTLITVPQPAITMTLGENNVWTGVIPQDLAGTRIIYVIVATNELGEETRSAEYEFTVAGGTNIAVVAENNSISVFPNPVVDVLTVTVADFTSGMTFNLFDVNGRMVQTGPLAETTTIDMTNLRAGTYILTIVQNGTQVATFRVVKQ